MLKILYLSILALSFVFIIPTSQAYAASGVGRIVHTYGPAWIERGDSREKIRKGRIVLRNDSIITGPRGRVKLIMGDGSKVYVGAKSRISLRKYSLRGKKLLHASIHMLWGKARFFVNKLASRDSSFRVKTSTAVLGVRGTEFSVWSPPTEQVLSRAFDKITLSDIPPLPTRTVLIEGAVDVDTGTGIQYRLTPGNTADVDSDRRVRVRKTNNEDLEETSRPFSSISEEKSTDKATDNNEPKKHDAQKQPEHDKKDSKSDGKKIDDPKSADIKKGNTGKQPSTANSKPAPQPQAAALPDNPQSSDASSIMLGSGGNALLDQPSMPSPPAVAAPITPVTASVSTAQGKGSGNKKPQPNGGTQPVVTASTNPLVSPAAAGIPIDTQATTNAIQNLGTSSAVKIKPNFVAP